MELPPHTIIFDDFLTQKECEELLNKITDEDKWEDSTVKGTGKYIVRKEHRKSKILSKDNCLRERNFIEGRIRNTILPITKDELDNHEHTLSPVHFQKYGVGDYFNPHRDTSSSKDSRKLTILVYLSDKFDGGSTNFHEFDISIKPKTGRALVFPATYLHSGGKVVAGEKYLATCWILEEESLSWI